MSKNLEYLLPTSLFVCKVMLDVFNVRDFVRASIIMK